MEEDRRHASQNGIQEVQAVTGVMKELIQSASSFWTPDRYLLPIVGVVLIVVAFVYHMYIRPIMPVQVKCWFCGETNVLPPDNQNRFDCRYCDQYNGFSADGDYNKDIPAQRDPSINVFFVEASRTGAKLSMYHNGLCGLCNNRQTRKVQAKNRFVPANPKREQQEFDEYCHLLEKKFPLCPACTRHVYTRISYQDAYLDPHVKKWTASRWYNRFSRFMYSEYVLLLTSSAPVISFYLSGWFQALPLGVILILMLGGMVKNGCLFASFIIRATTVAISQLEIAIEPQHRNALNVCSVIGAFMAFFKALQTVVCKVFGKKRRSTYPFNNVEDLGKVLSPLLSAGYSKLKQTQNWVQQKALFQLDSGFEALNLGKPAVKSLVGRVVPISNSSNIPKSFIFGKSSTPSARLLKPSRLSQSVEEFTPPPSQDNSSSEHMISASRWCYARNATQQGNDDANWDTHTTATQRTIHNVVYAPRDNSQSAIWTVAILLTALLLKLCWSDLVYVTRMVYVSFSHVLV